MEWYFKVIKQYVDFEGRARRKEFWIFVLFNITFLFFFKILDRGLGTYVNEIGYGILEALYSAFIFLPQTAVTVRRLHDIGKSGWYVLLSLIPIVGWAWLLAYLLLDSDPKTNQYGENPKLTSN